MQVILINVLVLGGLVYCILGFRKIFRMMADRIFLSVFIITIVGCLILVFLSNQIDLKPDGNPGEISKLCKNTCKKLHWGKLPALLWDAYNKLLNNCVEECYGKLHETYSKIIYLENIRGFD